MKNPTEDVLTFWFGSWPYDEKIANTQAKIWFQSSNDLDESICQKFSPLVHQALKGSFPTTKQDDVIANIILLDQFTRNIFRGTANAFSGDPQSLALCLDLINNKQHLTLPFHVAIFACMPLQHSEELSIQALSVSTFEELAKLHGEKANGFLEFAMKHKAIIDQFGRYPHRNSSLKRESTPQEQAYLNSDGLRFGQ